MVWFYVSVGGHSIYSLKIDAEHAQRGKASQNYLVLILLHDTRMVLIPCSSMRTLNFSCKWGKKVKKGRRNQPTKKTHHLAAIQVVSLYGCKTLFCLIHELCWTLNSGIQG